ncbi:MAG: NAD(P)-dependent oxidoreductase [Actinomycetota bacterium]|nr:NAD(P)-dependent oxidoreductase [Actinomycetota bacterium]
MSETVLVTGAAGQIGAHLRRSLARPGRRLRLLDVVEMTPRDDEADYVTASFLDESALDVAMTEVDAVIHLGGLSTGGYSWADYANVNITGTQMIFDAARRHEVSRVVYASSHHVMGRARIDAAHPLGEYEAPQPDSYYAVSKVAGEALARLYSERHGMDVVCVRIGSYRERPSDQRTLWNWLSPSDCTRLFEAALQSPAPGFRIVWGVSRNTTRVVSLDEGTAIGFHPLDDAEVYRDSVSPAPYDLDPEQSSLLGGAYTAVHFDQVN